jgi:hypothetical protein
VGCDLTGLLAVAASTSPEAVVEEDSAPKRSSKTPQPDLVVGTGVASEPVMVGTDLIDSVAMVLRILVLVSRT